MPLLERLQSRTQIKSHEFGQSQGKVRVAVGIDGQLRDVEFFVPNDTLDGGAGLTLIIENQGLSVEDAPAIAHVRVDADRGCLAAWIEAGLPDPLGGLKAHL